MIIIETSLPTRKLFCRRTKSDLIAESYINNREHITEAELTISYSLRFNKDGTLSKKYKINRTKDDFITCALILIKFYLPNTSIKKIKVLDPIYETNPKLKLFIRKT
jgi:hypothetical protein